MGRKGPTQRRNSKSNNKTSRKTNTKKLVKKAKPQELIESIWKQESAWDTSKTTIQNYDHIGVRVRVNGSTGGASSKIPRNLDFSTDFSETLNQFDGSVSLGKNVKVGGWKVTKAVSDGVVSLAQVEWDEEGNITTIGMIPTPMQVSQDEANGSPYTAILKERAQENSSKHRWASLGQIEYIKALHAKYGQDFVAMSKDKKINTNQLTPAQIRRIYEKVLSSSE